jgi:hypothetical protein
MDDQVYDAPSDTQAVDGNVAMAGPDGVSVVMTPEAAVETSHRLLDSGVEASGQRVEARRKVDERRALFPPEE